MDIPEGYCQCGCGQKTLYHKYGDRSHGYKKGEYSKYIRGHCNLPKIKKPVEERFWKFVDKGDINECWLWHGAKTYWGYGVIGVGSYKIVRAHRVSYEMAHDIKLSDDICVLHRCDNPSCVNPTHLFLGTNQDNMKDMHAKGRNTKILSIDEVKEIKQAIADGITQKSLAIKFGVANSTINSIAKGKTWAYV